MYADALKTLKEYKALEECLDELAHRDYDPFSGGMRYMEPGALPQRVAEGEKSGKRF